MQIHEKLGNEIRTLIVYTDPKGRKSFVCIICGNDWENLEDYDDHFKFHPKIELGQKTCPTCGGELEWMSSGFDWHAKCKVCHGQVGALGDMDGILSLYGA